ncbi:MAG: hypothetical protein FWG50_09695 [Kiritimatiellaeota bacterium]|nr:hypothetical protein [Kiritimatiellota bacterium]
MQKVIVFLMGAVAVFCGVAQETPASADDPQLAAIAEEIEVWKKEMVQGASSRASIETLLRQGVAFQRGYNAEKDSIVRSGMVEDYLKQRDEAMRKMPVTFFMSYGKEVANTSPIEVLFERDDLELDAKRPFALNLIRRTLLEGGQSKRRMLFSYKEGERFANMLAKFTEKAQMKEAASVGARDCVVSVQAVGEVMVVFMQLKMPTGVVSPEMYRITAFDAKLLVERIHAALKASPQPADYREPDDLDPATALFAVTGEEPGGKAAGGGGAAAAGGAVPAGTLSFGVQRIKITQGKIYAGQRIQQQFDYRVTSRWSGAQALNMQVVMYLVGEQGGKPALVGRDVKEATIAPGRAQEMLLSAEQVVLGKTAGGVIVQCFSGGRLLKSYADPAQFRKYAEMADIESQLPPLYQTPSFLSPSLLPPPAPPPPPPRAAPGAAPATAPGAAPRRPRRRRD